MGIILFGVFWLFGGIVNVLCWKRVGDYKNYNKPKMYVAILLSFIMSWILVYYSIVNDQFEIPNWLYHDCMEHSKITFEEEYLDKDGNKTDWEHCKVHHTYKIYTCQHCGKVCRKEQLQ